MDAILGTRAASCPAVLLDSSSSTVHHSLGKTLHCPACHIIFYKSLYLDESIIDGSTVGGVDEGGSCDGKR